MKIIQTGVHVVGFCGARPHAVMAPADSQRRPLAKHQASNVAGGTPVTTKPLNRLENMAIGGRAGLKLRRPAADGAVRAEQTADIAEKAPSASQNSTFALSTDASSISSRLAPDRRSSSPQLFEAPCLLKGANAVLPPPKSEAGAQHSPASSGKVIIAKVCCI